MDVKVFDIDGTSGGFLIDDGKTRDVVERIGCTLRGFRGRGVNRFRTNVYAGA